MTDQSGRLDTATIQSAAATIKRYLDDHPSSADTVEGVAEWWLAQQRIRETLAVVSEALELLIASGNVRRTQGIDGREIYSPAPLRRKAARTSRSIPRQPGQKKPD